MVFIFGLFSNFANGQGLPLESFNGGIPASWTINSSVTVPNNWVADPVNGYLGSPGIKVDPDTGVTDGSTVPTVEYYLITPQIVSPDVTEIRFFTRKGNFGNQGTKYDLRISTAAQPNINNFTSILTKPWTETTLVVSATTYEEKVIDVSTLSLPAGTSFYLAFVAIASESGDPGTDADTWFVDNVRVVGSCPPVAGITTTPVAGSSDVTINWQHATANNFEIQVVPTGQGIAASGTPVTGKQYTATGLANGATYDVYLKTVCDPNSPAITSLWAGPFTFTTQLLGLTCGTPLVIPPDITTKPYVLNANLADFYNTTTYVAMNAKLLSCKATDPGQNWLNSDHAFLSYTPAQTGLVNVGLSISVGSPGNYTNNCYNSLCSVYILDSCAAISASTNCYGLITTGYPSSVTSGTLPNVFMQQGKTYYFIISAPYQHGSQGVGMCFTFTLSEPSCPVPSGIAYDKLTQTGATFSWTNPGNVGTQWEYIAKPAAQGPPVAGDTLTPSIDFTNAPVSGLTPNTKYNFYVRSICPVVPATTPPTTAPGDWSVAFPFTTQCPVFPTPYSTHFTGDTPQNPEPCWTSFDLNNDGVKFTYAGDPTSGGPQGEVARLYTMTAGSNDLLVSPQIHLDGTPKRLRYKLYAYGGYVSGGSTVPVVGQCTFSIVASTTGAGPDNFTTIIAPSTTYQTGSKYVELIVAIPANIVGDVNIAWLVKGGPNTATNVLIDDVYVEDLPACSEPSYPGITAGSITQTTAQFYWTSGFANTQWEIKVQPKNSGIPTTSGQLVQNSGTDPVAIVYNMTGLTPSTPYEYYVRAYCSSTLQSKWVGPATFNSLCDALPTPYFESFNDTDVTSKKFCWSIINKGTATPANGATVGTDATKWTIGATNAVISPQDTFTSQFVSYDDYLVSAQVNAVGQKILKFNYKVSPDIFSGGQRGNLEVLMSSTPDFSSPTVLIPAHGFVNQEFAVASVIFTGTGPAYFAIRIPPTMDNPRNSGYVTIDDFSIDNVVSCPDPSLLSATNILLNTATLNWKPGSTETQWEIAIQSPNSGVPTSAGTVVNTNPTYNATGLTVNTPYEYYVRAICGSGASGWVGPFQFKTICSVLPTPFIETFEADSPSKSCWTIVNNNQDTVEWTLDATVNPMFGQRMAALNCFKNGQEDDWLITPTLAVKPNQRLRFYYKSLYDTEYLEDLKVRVSADGVDLTKFTTILYENNVTTTSDATGAVAGSKTITVASVAGVKLGDFFYSPSYPFPSGATVTAINGSTVTLSVAAAQTVAGPLDVVFDHEYINNLTPKEMIINLTGITAATNVNFAFQVPPIPPDPSQVRGSYLLIDNVIIEDVPVCPSVYNVTTNVKSISDTAATIDWQTAGSETSWQISLQPFGTPALVGNTQPQYLKTATAHPYKITGLTPSTRYQYYVRSVCTGTSENEWVGPFDILTKCDLSNACQYTISLSNGSTGQVYQGLNVIQNGVVQQSLTFPVVAPNQPTVIDYQVFLCSGIEFSLYWQGMGSGLQYSQAQVVIKDQSGVVVWTSPLGLGKINTNIFTGVSTCKTITCPQPTNLAVSNTDVLSWTPGGSETQWEVFVQPLGQGSIPQSGVIVTSPSYTPVASDFALAPTAGTNEFFVRAICSSTDKSYWTGPHAFIRNDEPVTAIPLQVNTDSTCSSQGTNASFLGATASATPTSCAGVNGGDIWYEFVATSKVATVELSNFAGSYYASGYGQSFPTIVLSLYEVQADGTLVEKACSENNSLVTAYSSELTVGNTYKIRVKYNDTVINNTTFNICVSAPADICNMDAFNYSFEKLPMQDFGGVAVYIYSKLVPGWRTNTDSGVLFFWSGSNAEGTSAYDGGQFVQLVQDYPPATTWDPAVFKGLYKDFDTPAEVLKVKYSFASATRSTNTGTTLELYAGPPAGPFTLVATDTTNSHVWHLITGTYVVPAGQTTTRFMFRVVGNAIGHILDAADFKVDTDVLTKDQTIDCKTTSVTGISAEGTGQWIVGTGNPSETTIETPSSQTTNISGFNGTTGVYTYFWKTRYCEKPFTVTIPGFADVATVTTPVSYCLNDTPVALTATAPSGFSLLWYTVPVGGTGVTTAPIPSTSAIGTTTYYVALVDNAGGCIGTRKAIDVIVHDYAAPIIGFSYDKTEYCQDALAPVITTDKGFTTGGTFTATPTGLTIDAATGVIDLVSSAPGITYTITYSVTKQDCHLDGSKSVSVKVDGPCKFIPKGISPDGDGKNDNLDLTALNIKRLEIFNRYGTEVYSMDNYKNEWHGQSNSGENLPDATYFYVVHFRDNTTLTGWVYVQRKL